MITKTLTNIKANTRKEELWDVGEQQLQKLLYQVDSLTDEALERLLPTELYNGSIRDLIYNIHFWHREFMAWHDELVHGGGYRMPARLGISRIADVKLGGEPDSLEYKCRGINWARNALLCSDLEVRELLKSHRENELFDCDRYEWTRGRNLAHYFSLVTISQYKSTVRLIRKYARLTAA